MHTFLLECIIRIIEGNIKLKEYECVLVDHHNKVCRAVNEYQKKGWHLHTYPAAGNANPALGTNHYLLFEKDQ